MKKIEIIWRELLFQALEKRKRRFSQKELARQFGFSTSTIFQALKVPRKMGAVVVSGRGFVLEDPEKLLFHWASVRDLGRDVIYATQVNLPVLEIEGQMPGEVVFGGFSAARRALKGDAPADYSEVYVYATDPEPVKSRFAPKKGRQNLTVLKADPFLAGYGGLTTLPQTFVDLWNLPQWYAKEYIKSLKQKIDELLS